MFRAIKRYFILREANKLRRAIRAYRRSAAIREAIELGKRQIVDSFKQSAEDSAVVARHLKSNQRKKAYKEDRLDREIIAVIKGQRPPHWECCYPIADRSLNNLQFETYSGSLTHVPPPIWAGSVLPVHIEQLANHFERLYPGEAKAYYMGKAAEHASTFGISGRLQVLMKSPFLSFTRPNYDKCFTESKAVL